MRNCCSALTTSLRELREEIGKTENYDMRQGLKADEERLKSLLVRLGATA